MGRNLYIKAEGLMSNTMDYQIRTLYIMVLKYGARIRGMVRLPMYYEIYMSVPPLTTPHFYNRDSIFINHKGNP